MSSGFSMPLEITYQTFNTRSGPYEKPPLAHLFVAVDGGEEAGDEVLVERLVLAHLVDGVPLLELISRIRGGCNFCSVHTFMYGSVGTEIHVGQQQQQKQACGKMWLSEVVNYPLL
jgi:hypothetical protein